MDFKVLAGNIEDGKVCISVCYIVGVSIARTLLRLAVPGNRLSQLVEVNP